MNSPYSLQTTTLSTYLQNDFKQNIYFNIQKVLLFEVISAYYTRLQQSLISSQWDEVINAIHSLISKYFNININLLAYSEFRGDP